LYYSQPFHNLTSVEHLGLDCKVEYTNDNQGIMPEEHNIWVQYMQSEPNDLDNTFQGQIHCCAILFISWTALNQIGHFQEHLPARRAISTFSKKCKRTQQWVLGLQAQVYAVVIAKKYNDRQGWADCVDRFIRVVKQTNQLHIVPGGAIVGQVHLVLENAALGEIDSIRPVTNHVNLDTYWTGS
jgi:hypothetical protein